jgi:hypothetical protein
MECVILQLNLIMDIKSKVDMGILKMVILKNPYDRTVFNIGYLGEGNYNAKDKNNKITKNYKVWSEMIGRCYDKKHKDKHPTYKDVTCCDEWLNFQNFAQWYDKNYYEIDNETMALDKDILFKGNKIYSPDTCIFVNQRINNLFTKSDKARGNYLIGVSYQKRDNMFQSRCKDENNKSKYLGYFNTEIEAFESYKTNKEIVIKKVAEIYKDKIPYDLYNSMYNYIVEITD